MSVMLYPCMLCVALLICLFVLCVACLTVFVHCLVKQFAMCLGVVAILLLNVHIKPSHKKKFTTSTQSISSALTVISAIMKVDQLSKLPCYQICARNRIVTVCVPCKRKARPRIPGMTLVAERPHDKYGSVFFSSETI